MPKLRNARVLKPTATVRRAREKRPAFACRCLRFDAHLSTLLTRRGQMHRKEVRQ